MTVTDGDVLGTVKVLDHGGPTLRWNIVILGDGYTLAELPKYRTDVDNFVATLYDTSPFDECWDAINIYRVDVWSTGSGADNPATCADGNVSTPLIATTYFDSTFCFGGAARRVLYGNEVTARATSLAAVPERQVTMVIVNTAQTGGSGGLVAWFSADPSAPDRGIHELAHTYFGLADEYAGTSGPYAGPEPAQPNVTRDANRATTKWRAAILPGTAVPTMSNPNCAVEDQRPSPVAVGTVGLFEGARYANCGLYRSEHQCKMRTLGQPFCELCQEQIRNKLAQFGGTMAWRIRGNAGVQPATDFLGTTDNQPVAIRTNASERVRISANGNVGIGTTTPGAGLEINKGATNDTALQVTSSGFGWGSGMQFRNIPAGGGGKTYGIYAGFGHFHFADVDSAVDRLMIHSSGRIGVGTGTPRAGLEIEKGNANEAALQVSSSGPGWGSGIVFHNRPAAGGGKTYGIYSGFGQFHVADVDNQVDRLVIESSGEIRIASPHPGDSLSVVNSAPNGNAIFAAAPNGLAISAQASAGPAIQGVCSSPGPFAGAIVGKNVGGGTSVMGETFGAGGGPAVRGINRSSGAGVQGQTAQTTSTSVGVRGMIGLGTPSASLLDGGVGVVGRGATGVVGRTSGPHPVQNGVEGHKEAEGEGAGVFATALGAGVGVYAEAATGLAGQFQGNISVSGAVTAGTKPFKIDHPLDPANRFLNHWSIESPEMLTVQSGSVMTDGNGQAIITLPEYVEALNRDFKYQLTPVGQFAQVMLEQEIENSQFVIRTDEPNVHVCWQVSGVRQDPFAKANSRDVEEEKSESERGRYLHPALHTGPDASGELTPIGYMSSRG